MRPGAFTSKDLMHSRTVSYGPLASGLAILDDMHIHLIYL